MKLLLIAAILACMVLAACLVLRPGNRISAAEAKKLMENGDCLVLDVRDRDEYAKGHIPAALSLPLVQVKAGAQELLPDKDQLILVYCLTGRRSRRACAILTSLGYARVKNLGGVMSWPYDLEKG